MLWRYSSNRNREKKELEEDKLSFRKIMERQKCESNLTEAVVRVIKQRESLLRKKEEMCLGF